MSDEDRIIRVARALCVADGNDPEAEIMVGLDDVENEPEWGRRLPTATPAPIKASATSRLCKPGPSRPGPLWGREPCGLLLEWIVGT